MGVRNNLDTDDITNYSLLKPNFKFLTFEIETIYSKHKQR